MLYNCKKLRKSNYIVLNATIFVNYLWHLMKESAKILNINSVGLLKNEDRFKFFLTMQGFFFLGNFYEVGIFLSYLCSHSCINFANKWHNVPSISNYRTCPTFSLQKYYLFLLRSWQKLPCEDYKNIIKSNKSIHTTNHIKEKQDALLTIILV